MRYQTIDRGSFNAEMAGAKRPCVLDVRPQSAFEAGHVPGARNVPVHDMGRRMKDLPAVKVTRVLVIADPGRRGEAACNFLALMGYADVALVAEGIAAWVGELETGPEAPRVEPGPELRVIPN
ncbi:MAG: rhodanese-like domain-containing protein [Planctomycetes bacterium]|nr:rhodanese-like domain-containing protein [Planctomycetota bacterium]